jgi:hypothetical protein
MVALFVTACGGDNDDGNPSTSQPPAGQPEAGSPEEPGKSPSQRPDPMMRCAP